MTLPTDETATLRGVAQRGVALARSYGWPVPERFDYLAEMYREALRIATTTVPPVPAIPDDVAQLEKSLTRYATAHAQHDALIEAARRVVADVSLSMSAVAGQSLPAWLDQLAREFDRAAATFLACVGAAPTTLHGHEDQQTVEAFMTTRRTAAELDRLLHARVELGTEFHESRAHAGLLWMVIDPPTPTDSDTDADTVQQLTTLSREYWSRPFQDQEPVARWRHLASLGHLSLPPFQGVVHRVERWDRLRGNFGGAPMMTALGQQQRRAEQDAERQTQLKRRAAADAEREANSAAVQRERQLAR